MKRFFTTCLMLCALLVLFAPRAEAQIFDVTIREINAIAQDSIDVLNTAAETLNDPQIEQTIFNPRFWDPFTPISLDSVRVVAIVMSDPTLSGLSSPDGDGLPSRVHFFVRDTSAATLGVEGMGIQVVDGSWQENDVLGLLIGDVVEIVGVVAPFDEVIQLTPQSITRVGSVSGFGLPASIMDPVVISTADVHRVVTGGIQANWSNLANLRGQYVRFENAIVQQRNISSDRPNWTFSSDGGATQLYIRDISLAYRNDRDGAYDDNQFRVFFDDFVPPPPGSGINFQGFLAFDDFDPFGIGAPDDGLVAMLPFERSDLEVTVTPPIVTNVTGPSSIVLPLTDVEITADVKADPTRTLTSVELHYYVTFAPDTMTVAGSVVSGDTYTFTVPGQTAQKFVTYWITGTDNVGAESQPIDFFYRVGGISQILDIQLTPDGGPGDSPYAGMTVGMDITGVIASNPDSSGFYALQQSGAEPLNPWSGILLRAEGDVLNLKKGDIVNVTQAEVEERFGVTQLRNVTLSVLSSDNPSFYKTVATSALVDESVAEAHEGMMLRFENVTVTTNQADGENDFGEWAISSDGTASNQIRVDGQSPAVTDDFNDDIVPGSVYSFVQGVWWFSFGNYKLIPEAPTQDVGDVTNVAIESEEIPDGYALEQNYPNPFNPSTTIRFDVAKASRVSVEVFDAVGRRVALLVDGELAPGTHTVTFDARHLASGMYVYRMRAGSEVINKTMMLLK